MHAPSSSAVLSPQPAAQRLLRPARLVSYHRLLVVALVVNLIVLVDHLESGSWRVADGSALSAFSGLTLVNLALAVVMRQQRVLNLLYALAGSCSPSGPLWLRWSVSKVTHIGGIHAGAALAGTGWLCAFLVAAVTGPASTTTVVLASALALLALVIVVCATPVVRAKAHDVFELTHRFGGWSSIAIFWVLTVHLAVSARGDERALEVVATDWRVWVLALVTACIVSPWLRLRRVAITVERPSSHAVIVTFDHGVTPSFSAAVAISRSPLREWHAFATVATPGRSGFRLLISRAGDWTGEFIDNPPSHVWVRGIPVSAPIAKATLLYRRILYVATGSGIGPILGQILANRVPSTLVWSTRTPRVTYGDALVDEVLAAQPDALVWDTTERGKPDLLRLTRETLERSGAEAVFVVSNQPTTRRLIDDLEGAGIPAFGPIWDS
jgi:hypothetical protein